jgi:hypothetical protein
VNRRRRGPLPALLAALVATACVATPPPEAKTAQAAASVAPKSDAGLPAERRADAPATIAALPPDATDTVLAPAPAPELPGPGHLVGLAGGRVESLLGAPGFRRRDPPAEVWRYSGESCRLFVFLYAPPDDADDYRVAHVEVRGASVVKVSDKACFHSLLKGRRKAG